ncbi:uncharacterized protein SAPINGB_P005054 [Magnusiomyces paraingens]|uniref:Mitochondrial import inner membrane translocase subunit TIM16 n=1 Tax=Magnusiomyces paraingens TaxID=2606893 RepID=A0A5E8C0K4_9ASCO|nr:uncharacterized protein SAPINGB_P005054 [Saprochaete ingens]VVT56430.1 unnamed protein product [Saprochaete ingens]
MAHRLIVQVIITGTQVFGKAFAEAYHQASNASIRAGASAEARKRTGGISYDEACKILDVDSAHLPTFDKLQNKYNYLFDVNSKDRGGSFYLQSKVYRSMERIKYELEKRGEKIPTNEGPAAGAEAKAGDSSGSASS